MKKRMIRNMTILIALVAVMSFVLYEFYYYVHINIEYIAEVQMNNIQIEDKNEQFIVITSKESREHYINKGLELPLTDFEKSNMIISRKKITDLKRISGTYDNGMAPLGEAKFDSAQSSGIYFIYKMEKIYVGQVIDFPGGLY